MSSHSRQNRRSLYPYGWGSGKTAYVSTFRAFSLSTIDRSSLEIGDKIILPINALESINKLRLPFPLLFEIKKHNKLSSKNKLSNQNVLNEYKKRIKNIYRSTNPSKLNKVDQLLTKYSNNPHQLYLKICSKYGIIPKSKIKTHKKSLSKQYASVYEFSSPQSDTAYIPQWMMQNIGINPGDEIQIESKFNIKKGTFCVIQPFKKAFMDKVGTIGYKSTLEQALTQYSVLTINQRIVIEFNHIKYQFIIKDLKPDKVISILGSTDLEIQFAEPLDQLNQTNNETKESFDNISNSQPSDIHPNVFNKLGVPLGYHEQIDLANSIIENRKQLHVTDEEDESDIPPLQHMNHVRCENCDKYIHNMSITTHEMHCHRQFIRCKICNESVNKKYLDEHCIEMHKEFKCICDEQLIFIGERNYNIHLKTCKNYKGVNCVLCDEYIDDEKDKLLHLLTVCKERRAVCNYCGVFRRCNDMEKHREYCGSRSEQCVECNQFVALMNMKQHLKSKCEWGNNKQLSKKSKRKLKDVKSDEKVNKNSDGSLFGLLKSNEYLPNMCDLNMGDMNISEVLNKQLCPYCVTSDMLMDEEELQMHLVMQHPDLINDSLAQTVLSSFGHT